MAEENWQGLLREASQLRASGRVDDSIAAYKRLLAIKPDLPDSWYNLAWLQRQARAFDDALASYQRALDLDIAKPEEVHLNRAVIYSDHLHRPDEADRELRAALDKNSGYLPALLNLGNLHEDFGDRFAARAAYQQALDTQPDNGLALARLASVSASAELDVSLAARLRSRIGQSGVSPAEQADLGFALAALLDAAGKYDEAFAAARKANQASQAAAAVSYDRAAHERFVDRLIATFSKPAEPLGTSEGEAPLFICGLFRSGSTLVEQILASHSRVTAGGELDLIPALVAQIRPYPEALASAEPALFERLRGAYLARMPAAAAGTVVTDKRPDNFLHIGLIKAIFPEARIVHTRRDPLDNLLSLYFLHLDPGMAYALDLEDAAHWHRQYRRLMAHWKALYGRDIHDVDYDALVRDPRPVVEELLGFCGLEWEDRCLEFHSGPRVVKTASVWQVREPLYTRSSGRRRHYERHLRPLIDAVEES